MSNINLEAAAAESLPDKLAGGGTKNPQSKLGDNLHEEGQAIHELGLFSKNPNNGDTQRINGIKEKRESKLADIRAAGPLKVPRDGAAEAGRTDNQERNMDQRQIETDEGTDVEIEEILSQVSEQQQNNQATEIIEMNKQRPISRRSTRSPSEETFERGQRPSKRERTPSEIWLARKLQNIGNMNEDLDDERWEQIRDEARSQGVLSSEDEDPLSRSLPEDEKLELIDELLELFNQKVWENGLELDEKDQALVNKASTLINKWKEMPMVVETRAVGTSPRKAMQSPVEAFTGTAAEALSEQDLAAKETLPEVFHWEQDLAAKTEAEASEAANFEAAFKEAEASEAAFKAAKRALPHKSS